MRVSAHILSLLPLVCWALSACTDPAPARPDLGAAGGEAGGEAGAAIAVGGAPAPDAEPAGAPGGGEAGVMVNVGGEMGGIPLSGVMAGAQPPRRHAAPRRRRAAPRRRY